MKPTDVYVTIFASADRSDMGGGAYVSLTEAEAVDHVRDEVKNSLDNSWDGAEWPTEAEAVADLTAIEQFLGEK